MSMNLEEPMLAQTSSVPANPQVIQFAKESIDRYSRYRDHKETMAYAGAAVYVGAAAAIILSKDWPPSQWGPSFGIVAVVTLWALALSYLKYQLRKRRWAAFRVAGCEWILARA